LQNFGDKPIRFKDDTFTCKPSWAIGVCSEIIDRGLDIKWDLLARASGLKEEVLMAAREAGAYKIRIGIESGSELVRQLINKELNSEDIYRAVELARKTRFKSIGTFFMIGLPGEREVEIEQTYNMVRELDADYVSFKPADIYPNTGLYDMAAEKKLIPDPFPWFDPSTIERYPEGFLVYSGIPTFTEYFGRDQIQAIASSLYTNYFAEKLFSKNSEPSEMFFEEMGFMGILHYKPLRSIFKVGSKYFRSRDKVRRRKGLFFMFKLLKERLNYLNIVLLRLIRKNSFS
jgi:radical SAM superfamily enzyme YgiQ (UPF0313 family)